MDAVETIQHESAPLAARIVYDEDALNPREEFSNLWTLVLHHRRYNLGDTHDLDLTWDFDTDVKAAREVYGRDALIVPVWGHDHGQLVLRASDNGNPFYDPWDSGLAGFAVVSREGVRNAFMVKRATKDVLAKAREGLDSEIETYNAYLTGSVYGYEIVTLDEDGEPTGEVLDSCYGYYADRSNDGLGYVVDAAKEAMDAEASKSPVS